MNVYKLKSGKTQGAFQLPLRNEMVTKVVEGEKRLKKIHYIPGADSIFVEDYKGDEKPKPVWFDDGELRVAEENWTLNEVMKNHSWFNKIYVLVNEEATAELEVAEFEKITRANNRIINEKDDHKLRAMAMSIISLDAINWEPFKCKAQLLNYAKNHSSVMIAEMDKPNYENKYIAALAFSQGVVKYNLHHTAVVWGDGDGGTIVKVVEGETGVEKLGRFISVKNESSESVLKRLGEVAEESFVESAKEVAPIKSEAQLRKEIEAKVRAEIAAENVGNEPKLEVVEKAKEDAEIDADNTKEENKAVDYTKLSLEALQEEYKRVTGKNLSPAYAKDVDWMISKINATPS